MSNNLAIAGIEVAGERALEKTGVGTSIGKNLSVGLAQIQVQYAIKYNLTNTVKLYNSAKESGRFDALGGSFVEERLREAIRAELITERGSIRASARFIAALAREAMQNPGKVDKKLVGALDWTACSQSDGGPSEAFDQLGPAMRVAIFFGAAHNDANVTGPYNSGYGETQGGENTGNAFNDMEKLGLFGEFGLR